MPQPSVAEQNRPDRLPATYRRTHGITYFHGCHSVGDDKLWGINRRRKGIDHTWARLRTIRATRPDGALIYVSAHFGPLRQFTPPTPTTPTTPSRPGPRTPTCAGATRTRAIPTSAGAADHYEQQPDHPAQGATRSQQ